MCWDTVVGTVTQYGLDSLEIDSWYREIFHTLPDLP